MRTGVPVAVFRRDDRAHTVQQVADHLGLHVRTVRSYVREGTLPAVRVGRQYRVTRDDLAAFTGQPAAPATAAARAEVSATIQVRPVDRRTADRLTTLLVGMAQSRSEQEDPPLHVHTVFEPAQRLLRVVVMGGPDDTAALLGVVGMVTEEAP